MWAKGPASDPAMDERFMEEALALGRASLGTAWPNPAVGALVVKDGVIVGRGATAPGGRPHAEAIALAQAGDAAVGATLYVTLEPCAHRSVRGGTPCVEHTFFSGIRRVVSAIPDPNPHIAGVGHALLRSMGLSVREGVCAEDALWDHRGHIKRVQSGLPFVTLKLAQTADGYCGRKHGGRLQISSPEAMQVVHRLRAQHDAIMVGIGTVISDNPILTIRLDGEAERSSVRIVIDSRLRLPLDRQLVQTASRFPLWVVTSEDAPAAQEHALRGLGVDVMRVGCTRTGQIDLRAAMQLLAIRGITRIFSEGGPLLGEALAVADLVDQLVVSTSQIPLDDEGVQALRPALSAMMHDRTVFVPWSEAQHGTDHLQSFRRSG